MGDWVLQDFAFFSPKRYVGDITSADLATPRKANISFDLAKRKIIVYRNKIGVLHRRNNRMRARVTNFKNLLNFLKQRNMISEGAQETIEISIRNIFILIE